MSDATKIEWADATWNPIRARLKEPSRDRYLPVLRWGYHCERISHGCKNCYAATMNKRMLPAWGTGLDYTVPNREKVEIFLDEGEWLKPLHWGKPRSVFPCSMTDWCATFVNDEMRDRMLAVAALCPQHRFLFLTKRADRCAEYFNDPVFRTEMIGIHSEHRSGLDRYCRSSDALTGCADDLLPRWPLPLRNVYLGFSAEDQECFDARWSHMRKLAAAGWNVWCSAEPLLSGINMEAALRDGLSWVVVGGESGHGARPFNIQWARDIIRQCKDAGTAVFCKQLGANPEEEVTAPIDGYKWMRRVVLKDRKGSDMSEWPEDLRVREVPR